MNLLINELLCYIIGNKMSLCFSCRMHFETNALTTYCDACFGAINAYFANAIELLNGELPNTPTNLGVDGWIYIRGETDQALFGAYFRLLEIVGLANIPNTFEVVYGAHRYIFKIHAIDVDDPMHNIVPRGKLDPNNKVLTQPIFIKRRDIYDQEQAQKKSIIKNVDCGN